MLAYYLYVDNAVGDVRSAGGIGVELLVNG